MVLLRDLMEVHSMLDLLVMVDHQLDLKVVPQGQGHMDSMVHHLMVQASMVIQGLVDSVNMVHLHMAVLRLDLHLSSHQEVLVAEDLLLSRVLVHSVHKTYT